MVCDQATFEYPNIGTLQIPPGECLGGPVFVGIEMRPGNAQPTPQLVLDNQPEESTCDRWFFKTETAQWFSWYRMFDDTVVGYPLIDVTITESDTSCGFFSCTHPGDVDNSGQFTIGDATYWVNWMFGGGPPPVLQDLNCDCILNSEDEELWDPIVLPIFICGFPPCVPVELICGCPLPYREDCLFLPGDADGNGTYSIGDAVFIINTIFNGGVPPVYQVGQQDANGDCEASLGDAVYIINFVFAAGPAPVGCEEWPSNCGGIY
jgi:hypothetical protein